MKQDEIPKDVMYVWCATMQNNGLMGTEMYQKCKEIIKRYPKYFKWEHIYDSLPQEVHDAYLDEKYPDRHKPIECNYSGKGILHDIMNTPTVIEMPIQKSFTELMEEIFASEDKRNKEIQEQYQKEKDLWDKHYKKYKLEYRK